MKSAIKQIEDVLKDASADIIIFDRAPDGKFLITLIGGSMEVRAIYKPKDFLDQLAKEPWPLNDSLVMLIRAAIKRRKEINLKEKNHGYMA